MYAKIGFRYNLRRQTSLDSPTLRAIMTSMSTKTLPHIQELGRNALHLVPQERDWLEGYGESWEYIEAPSCPVCGELCNYESQNSWHCSNVNCAVDHWEETQDVDPYGDTTSGPVMSYAYLFPRVLGSEDADLIGHLPLCVVNYLDEDRPSELALTGGGMDLTWEICEAYMLLGELPPVHFADLPLIAGRGQDERDRWIIEGCRRAATEHAALAASRAANILDSLDRIGGSC